MSSRFTIFAKNTKIAFVSCSKDYLKQELSTKKERCRCPRKFAPPPDHISQEIWPPQKHSLLHRFKLGNRKAFSKMMILKVFVSIYGWFA